MSWAEDILVKIRILSLFRIGAGRGSLIVDLPLVKEKIADKSKPTYHGANLTSSFRGVLRKSIRKMVISTNLSCFAGIEENLFGSHIPHKGEPTAEGKLHFQLEEIEFEGRPEVRTGIRIDQAFGSVEPQALFDYEALLSGDALTFRIRPLYALDDVELAILLAGLNGLHYDCFGGFASRGLGIIEEVEVMNKTFLDCAIPTLKRLLEGCSK